MLAVQQALKASQYYSIASSNYNVKKPQSSIFSRDWNIGPYSSAANYENKKDFLKLIFDLAGYVLFGVSKNIAKGNKV